MVRTKGDGATTKVVGAKAPRKQLVSNTGGSSSAYSPNDSSKKSKPSTGLPYCPQPTPEWQKSVKSFFTFSGDKSSERSGEEDKENEIMIVEPEGSEDGSKKSKGKQPSKGKRSKKGSKTKKTSKPEVETNGEMSEETTVEAESKDSDSNEDKPETRSDNEEPVQRKRNRIIESDEDE